jgi:pyridoxal phosphate enzyme (YggS family)
MNDEKIRFSNNLNIIEQRIRAICKDTNRNPDSIEIVPATKTRSQCIIDTIIEDGRIKTCGENRVQEFLSKYTHKIQWDIIGQLQTNKVRFVIDKVRLIQSVDRESLLFEINKRAGAINKIQSILIEINAGDEETKGGIAISDVDSFALEVAKYENVCLNGLMAVVPIVDTATLRSLYSNVRKCYNHLKEKFKTIKYLSMGMSNDFEIAIEYGANIIRPGRVLFE